MSVRDANIFISPENLSLIEIQGVWKESQFIWVTSAIESIRRIQDG